MWIPILLTVAAIATEPRPVPTTLAVSPSLVDVGTLWVGDSVDVPVNLTQTQGDGTVSLTGLTLTDEGVPGLAFTGDLPSIPEMGTAQLVLTLAPTQAGAVITRLQVESDADCTEPEPVYVRAQVQARCLSGLPTLVDFGEIAAGDSDFVVIHVESCAGERFAIDALEIDDPAFTTDPTPIQMVPGGALVAITFAAADAAPRAATLTVRSGSVTLGQVQLVANDCPNGDPAMWSPDPYGLSTCGTWLEDPDADGWTALTGDCREGDPTTWPGADELDDGVDNDCDGQVDEHLDTDQDGIPDVSDCEDADPWVHPGAVEWFDQVDNDCDGDTDEEGGPTDTCPPWVDPDDGSDGCGCASTVPAGPWAPLILLGALIGRTRSPRRVRGR